MASIRNLTFFILSIICFTVSVYCDDGSGDESSGVTGTMFDVTEIVTELVTDGDDSTPSPSDLQGYGLIVTNDFTEFTLGVDNIVTYNFTIRNAGGTDIASSSDDLYDLSVIVSDNSNPNSNSATTMTITPLLTAATNLDAGIASGASIVIENVHTMINIAEDDCSTYENGYVCVEVSKVSGASYTDSDTSNNYYCLEFGAVNNGYTGVLTCAACTAKVSLFAMLLSALAIYFVSS